MKETRDKAVEFATRLRDDVRKRSYSAIDAILTIAFGFRRENFSFGDFPELESKVNKILVELSNENLAAAESLAKEALTALDLDEYYEEATEEVEGEDKERAYIVLDRQGDHLKDILTGWIIVAAVCALSLAEIRNLAKTFLDNPFASEMWRKAGLKKPSWGSGQMTNPVEHSAVAAQDALINIIARAEMLDAIEKGAGYYIRHRGSDYPCDLCDSFCERPLPMTNVIIQTHMRCVCWNEYFYAG